MQTPGEGELLIHARSRHEATVALAPGDTLHWALRVGNHRLNVRVTLLLSSEDVCKRKLVEQFCCCGVSLRWPLLGTCGASWSAGGTRRFAKKPVISPSRGTWAARPLAQHNVHRSARGPDVRQ